MNESILAAIPAGFEIKIIPNSVIQKGTGILMVHPDDIPKALSSTPPVEKGEDEYDPDKDRDDPRNNQTFGGR